MKSDSLNDDRDIIVALNNTVLALMRWKRVQEALADHPTRLRSFAEGVLGMVRDAITVVVASPGGGPSESKIVLSDAEIAICLQLAVLMSVLHSDWLPEDSPMRSVFAASLVKERKQNEAETPKESKDVRE